MDISLVPKSVTLNDLDGVMTAGLSLR